MAYEARAISGPFRRAARRLAGLSFGSRLEAGEPTGAREHVCGPSVILTADVKGAREGARVKIMLAGRPQTAGRASRSGEGLCLAVGRRGEVGGGAIIKAAAFMI